MIQSLHLTSGRWRQAMRIAALVLAAATALLTGSSAAAQASDQASCARGPAGRSVVAGRAAPRLIGLSAARAEQMLRSYNVSPRRIAVPSNAPQGQVVDQWPEPDDTIMDQLVILCISSGAPTAGIAMPDLFHQTEAAARRTLIARRIRNVPTILNAQHPEARGVVFGQSPEAGTPVTAATRIALQVSSGPPPPILMPALRGLSFDQAVQALTNAQIPNRREIVRVEHAEPRDEVFGQSPEWGTPVDAATRIALQVSSGPAAPPPPILMPALVGRTLGEAQQALSGLQLARAPTVAYAEHVEARGVIYHQSPEAGASLGADDTIVLDVSNGPATGATAQPPVEVPPLAGLGEGEARALLERTGLVGIRDGSENSFLAPGQVVRSSPDAGERVPRGSAVRYVLSLGPSAEPERSILDWLADNPTALAALIVLALVAAAVVAKVLVPRRLKVTVHMPGRPRGKVDWWEPPEPAFDVRVGPPRAKMRRAADPREEGA